MDYASIYYEHGTVYRNFDFFYYFLLLFAIAISRHVNAYGLNSAVFNVHTI